MIDFSLTPEEEAAVKAAHKESVDVLRPLSHYYDEHEHEDPADLQKRRWARRARSGTGVPGMRGGLAGPASILVGEEGSWGDAGLGMCSPGPGLGGAAIMASGTPEQVKRFLQRYEDGEPKWGAMAMTEPGAGSDTSAIATTAVRDGDSWVLNGEKIFVTSGKRAMESGGLIVVWATVDRSAGRAGMKPFVVEAGTPGLKLEKVENKMGLRASDTCTIVLEDCRIPYENLLGSAEVRRTDSKDSAGFRRAMATFDNSRPGVAAQGIGIARASLDFVKEALEKEGVKIRYGLPRNKLTSLERDIMEMESSIKAARMLTLRAVWLSSQKLPNNMEASMAKARAGQTVTRVTQKCIELLGPLGYSRKNLLEKWMRDGKINDIFEGTGQINTLIVARRLLGFSSSQLK
jgi:acyl-CoA dehydrogenase